MNTVHSYCSSIRLYMFMYTYILYMYNIVKHKMEKLRLLIADLEKCTAFELSAEAADGGDEALLVQLPFENINDLQLFREQLGAFGMQLSVLICSLKEALEFFAEYTRVYP